MTGQELFEKVFATEKQKWAWFEPYEIEEAEGVICYENNLSHLDGWYSYGVITFRYEGKKYSLDYKTHVTEGSVKYLIDTFREVATTNELDKAIDKIIKNVEEETMSSWEELIQQLEYIKTNFGHLGEK